MIEDMTNILFQMHTASYLVLVWYAFLGSAYGILWYFKRPVILALRKHDIAQHLASATALYVFYFLLTLLIYLPSSPNSNDYNPEAIRIFPIITVLAAILHALYFLGLYLLEVRKKIPGAF